VDVDDPVWELIEPLMPLNAFQIAFEGRLAPATTELISARSGLVLVLEMGQM
jgi:hypothetical protein